MNRILETLTNHIIDENSVFVFSTEIACTSWQDKLLNDEIIEAIPLEKFIAWDIATLKVVVGKGYATYESIINYINIINLFVPD